MNLPRYKKTIEFDFGDGEGPSTVEIEFECAPGTPDVHSMPNGDPGYPGDPAELYIVSARINTIPCIGAALEKIEESPRVYDLLCEHASEKEFEAEGDYYSSLPPIEEEYHHG